MTVNPETLRVFKNIDILLRTGLWTGESSPAIAEARSLIAGVVADLESKVEQETRDRPEHAPDSGRVGGGRVQNRKRKNSKRKADAP